MDNPPNAKIARKERSSSPSGMSARDQQYKEHIDESSETGPSENQKPTSEGQEEKRIAVSSGVEQQYLPTCDQEQFQFQLQQFLQQIGKLVSQQEQQIVKLVSQQEHMLSQQEHLHRHIENRHRHIENANKICEEIKSFQLPKDDAGKFLTNISLNVQSQLTFTSLQELYIREAYETIEEVIEKSTRVLIIGNPGIGKSCFGLYMLHKFIKNRSVCYHRFSQYYVFLSNGTSYCYTNENSFLEDKPNFFTDCTLIYDVGRKAGIPINVVSGFQSMIVVSTPETTNYQDFQTNFKPTTVYMPIWSREEIDVIARKGGFTMDTIDSRFAQFGGIPRYVFADEQSFPVFVRRQNSAIKEDFLQALPQLTLADLFPKLSHYVIQMDSDEEDKYSTFTIRFATRYVECLIFEELKESHLVNAINFLVKVLVSSTAIDAFHLGVVSGFMFEQVVHTLFIMHGAASFKKVRRLLTSSLMTPPVLKIASYEHFHRISEIEAVENVLYIPTASNHPTFDSLLIVKGTVYLFQTTIRKKHPISVEGLKQVKKNDAIPKNCRLYFVVPEHAFKDGFQSEQQVSDDSSIDQYVVWFDLTEFQ